MKKSIVLLLCLAGMISCSKREDLFDKAKVEEESKENFPAQDIDPDHDWNMTSVGALKVSVNQGSGEVYTVKVYTANPLNEQSGARLMAKREQVKDGTVLSLTFDMPKATAFVYVLLEDKIYNRSVKMVDMSVAAPQVSWGAVGRSVRSANALSRSVISYIAPTDADFFNDIPAGAQPYPTTWTGILNGNYYLENCEFSQLHGGTTGTYNLFIKGTVSLGSDSWPAGTTVYVLPGSTLEMSGSLNLLAGTALYISRGGTLNVTNMQLTGGGYSQLYNRGTVLVSGTVEENSNGDNIIYNDGSFEASVVNITNSTTFINLSELRTRQLAFSASGRLLNESGAKVVVSGETSLANRTNIIENNGSFTTASLKVSGGMQLYNNCRFTVTGAAMLRGDIQQDGQACFEADEVKMDGMTINLGSESMFYVKSAMTYSGGQSRITGVGDKSALLWVDAVCQYAWKSVTYSGNLKVAVKGHTPENTQWNIYYIAEEAAEIIGTEQVKLGTANGCGNSYTTDNGGTSTGTDTPLVYTYAFEDITTTAGDYDFNDVVLKVSAIPVDGKMEVQLVAAGATKNLKVFYGNTPLFDAREVHAAMGCEPGQMVNTGGVKGDIVTDCSIVWPGDGTLGNADFKILDVENNMYVSLPKYSTASIPYAIVVPKDWDYPGERQRVDHKYPHFTDWAEDMAQEPAWYD